LNLLIAPGFPLKSHTKPFDASDDQRQLCATDLSRQLAPVLGFKLQKVEGA
jgi:hypothetical protein